MLRLVQMDNNMMQECVEGDFWRLNEYTLLGAYQF